MIAEAGRIREGSTVWVIEHNNRVREVKVVRMEYGFATVRFPQGGMARLRESRLYIDQEDAIRHHCQNPERAQNSRRPDLCASLHHGSLPLCGRARIQRAV